MPRNAKHTFKSSTTDNGQPRYGPPEETAEDDDALELPVEPDEGMPLIPDDDERVVNVPS
jgi:hypothetical protein